MTRRPLIVVCATLAIALTGLVVMGRRVLERDRADLFARYGEARAQGIEEAARGVASAVADIGDDLDLASTLVQGTSSREVAERELHAIATIKREYLVMYARIDGDVTTKVTAYDAPPGVAALADRTLEHMLRVAEDQPRRLHVSEAFAEPGVAAGWYRVFARRTKDDGPIVAVVVDTAVLLGRMKLQRDATTRVAVIDSRGAATAASDRELARIASSITPAAAGTTSRSIVGGDTARQIELPETDAIVIATPLAVDGGLPWTLLVATSTQALQTQEQTIVRRVLLGSALVLILLLSAAAYVVHSTYRARALRERVKHTDRLAYLTEKAEKILDHIPSGVLALSDDRRVTGVNKWLAERIGRDVIGRRLDRTFDHGRADDIALVVELVDRALALHEPQSLHRDRIALLGPDASLNLHAVPLARGGGGDVSVLLVLDDLTELRRIEQRLLHSEKLVTAGQLAAGIAHEIGTPLNVARGRVELALTHLGSDHGEADNHRVVIEQIDRVTRLIQHLLDYVRPTRASVQDVDLAYTLHEVKELLAPQAAKRHVVLDIATSGASTLRSDPDQVQQIVVNLTLNAIDACVRGGVVALRAKPHKGSVVLEIEDTGHGMTRDVQKQAFDPFFTTKKRGQGTGLGLWVVAQLVRAQAAEIEVDSAPGRGTTVRVAWPVTS